MMGVVVEKVSKHPTELVLLGGLAVTFYHLNQQRREKDELRALLQAAISNKEIGIKEF